MDAWPDLLLSQAGLAGGGAERCFAGVRARTGTSNYAAEIMSSLNKY